ncbi:hypothetical protein VIA_003688 [Vibrio orientalis CIP 102891 = ATCC 33934]|uniref:Uncharacterized protein n=1 Tax=Vibrio orientalis CIP 102891 = ATCC 33934 TaxID=675816 RepID=A0ABM9Z095_VIBOR|nr:hypothetical protein VIA_003688 [Vibrio orientalis CIP 102891 = ATCC 33934]
MTKFSAHSAESGVLYCFKNQLTSVADKSIQSVIKQGICPYSN